MNFKANMQDMTETPEDGVKMEIALMKANLDDLMAKVQKNNTPTGPGF